MYCCGTHSVDDFSAADHPTPAAGVSDKPEAFPPLFFCFPSKLLWNAAFYPEGQSTTYHVSHRENTQYLQLRPWPIRKKARTNPCMPFTYNEIIANLPLLVKHFFR